METPTPVDMAVVIVSWNARDYLKQCLDSIYQAACDVRFAVWVVDNASRDGSPEMITTDFPQVQLIQTGANLGFAGGNNIGIERSQGRYLFLINSDVIIEDHCFDRLCAYMDAHPEVGLAGPRVLNADRSLQASCMLSPTPWRSLSRALALDTVFSRSALFAAGLMEYWAHDQEREVDVLVGCFWVARRSALEKVGLLDEDYFMYMEDMDWSKRFRDSGWQVRFIPEVEIIHFGGGSSANAPVKYYLEHRRSNLFYWRKHHGHLGLAYYYLTSLLYEMVRILRASVSWLLHPARRKENRHKLHRSLVTLGWLLNLPKLKLKKHH